MKKGCLLLLMVFGLSLTVEAQGRRVYDDNENTYDAVGYDSYGNRRSVPRDRRAYYDDDANYSRNGYDSRDADYYDDERNVPPRRKRAYDDDPYDDADADRYNYNPQNLVPKGQKVVYNDNDRTYDAVGVDKSGQLRSVARNGKYYRSDNDERLSLYRNANARNSQRTPDRRRAYDDYDDYDE